MQDIHSDHYPKFKLSMMKVGKDISTPDFQVTFYSQTKSKDTKFGSSYVCKIHVVSSDEVTEEEFIRYIKETNWQKVIIQKLRKYYPGAKEVESGIYIPSIERTIEIPDGIFPNPPNVREIR